MRRHFQKFNPFKIGGRKMAHYLTLSNLTEKGCETLRKKPERIKEVNSEVEAMGGKIISQHALLGEFDFATVIEAPDNGTVAKISLNLCSRGTIMIQTLPAVSLDELIGSME
jgi:uncharacterized protein with GYD domain